MSRHWPLQNLRPVEEVAEKKTREEFSVSESPRSPHLWGIEPSCSTCIFFLCVQWAAWGWTRGALPSVGEEPKSWLHRAQVRSRNIRHGSLKSSSRQKWKEEQQVSRPVTGRMVRYGGEGRGLGWCEGFRTEPSASFLCGVAVCLRDKPQCPSASGVAGHPFQRWMFLLWRQDNSS